MAIQSHRIEPSVKASLRPVLDEAAGEVLAVNFDERATSVLVEVLSDLETPPSVRLLTKEDVLKWLRDDFGLASEAAELIEAETLAARAATESLENTLVVTEETVISLLTPDDDYSAALVTDDEEFVEAVRERWSSVWEESETFDLRTPAYSRVLESLGEEFESAVASDFDTVLDALGSTRDETVLDEVGVSLLVAARHEKMLYDLSKWGEDTGVASKATFSRAKTNLEEQGLLDTEKVPIDVGRPRLRLLLGDERLREADPEELPSVVREMLAAIPA
ncbi:transcriptional regulator TbsP [Halococcus sp. AFM35]|uniref:transcriptional regulator TbsP n=1 Tax=Halococcus sp. AFM35 TaxID=3421653 RepID=UPI003EBD2B03